MAKKKKYSTVVIFDKTQADAKHLRVRSEHIEHWKKYVLIGLGFVSILAVLLVFYARQASKNERAAIMLHEYQEEVLKPLATDTNVAKRYIRQIEMKMQRVEQYLDERGVEIFRNNREADATLRPAKQAILTYVNYNYFLTSLYVALNQTPLGLPVARPVNSNFGYRKNPHGGGRKFHSGIDIEGDRGDKIRSTASGKVILAGWNGGYGQCVIVAHQSGYQTLYGHLSKILVRRGQKVNASQLVGLMGSTGHSTGTHLHYEVHRKGRPINPARFLKL